MRKIVYIIVAIVTTNLFSCKDAANYYDGENVVYFNLEHDTVKYSFAYTDSEVERYETSIDIQIIGGVTDYDREVRINSIANNCVEGVDFEPFQEFYTLEARKSFIQLPVVIKRSSDLTKIKKSFAVELVESKDFQLLYLEKPTPSNSDKNMSQIKCVFEFSDILDVQPGTWNEYYFGVFSAKKFITMCDYLEIPRMKFIDRTFMSDGRKPYVAKKMKGYFAEMKAKGQTIYEEDNVTEMKMGDKI